MYSSFQGNPVIIKIGESQSGNQSSGQVSKLTFKNSLQEDIDSNQKFKLKKITIKKQIEKINSKKNVLQQLKADHMVMS